VVSGGCGSLISLPGRSIQCLTTLEEFCTIESKKLDLIRREKRENPTTFPSNI
jgi:hypothetical protein